MTDDRLCLLQVHAHPDDEASKGSGTNARYSAEGVHTVLVTCTDGAEGDILNPAADTPEVRADLRAVRLAELDESIGILGYGSSHMLGYRDSGMKGTEANTHPESFAMAPLDEATEKLVRIIRSERPQVLITYGDDHRGYPHPDHIRTHDISVAAFDAAGDPDRFPDAGPPFQPSKLYYTAWTRIRLQTLHDVFVARGEESPYADWLAKWDPETPDRAITTRIDVGDYLDQRRASLLAHRTQVDPEGFWMRLPEEIVREVFPWEEFFLARSLVDAAVPEGDFEDDLFSGLRVGTSAERRAG
jgi:mycothiol S-conjugate amidase